MAAIEFLYDLTELLPLEDNFGRLERVDGTNIRKAVVAFANGTVEFRNGKFMIPADVDTVATVTFTLFGMSKTAVASKNVALRFDHIAKGDAEAHDVAYTASNSGDMAMDDTQDNLTKLEWTEAVSSLAWAADDLVYFRLSRQAALANDLAGDLYLEMLRVNIPVT